MRGTASQSADPEPQFTIRTQVFKRSKCRYIEFANIAGPSARFIILRKQCTEAASIASMISGVTNVGFLWTHTAARFTERSCKRRLASRRTASDFLARKSPLLFRAQYLQTCSRNRCERRCNVVWPPNGFRWSASHLLSYVMHMVSVQSCSRSLSTA